MTRSQAFRRPPRFTRAKAPNLPSLDSAGEEMAEEGEEDEDTPTFLPFSPQQEDGPDLGATVRGQRPVSSPQTQSIKRAEFQRPIPAAMDGARSRVTPQVKRHRNELGALSPTNKGSDGSPSMGSSYSDLLDGEFNRIGHDDGSANSDGMQTTVSRTQRWRRRWRAICSVEAWLVE